jgi:predicted ATPase/DNA-binding CsgD family transcriptional regulator
MQRNDKPDLLDPLTERELDILRLIAEGLSNGEIAEKLILSLGTVKWYNTQIFDKLGVKNRTQAIARIREWKLLDLDAGNPAPAAHVSPTRATFHNLPGQALPLIGREDALADIFKLLTTGDRRLLTLVGPGGIGKTHMAVEAAARMLASFPDGVYFVPLAPLCSPDDILLTVSNALGFQLHDGKDPLPQVLARLRDRHLLLVMDNFDDLMDGTALVAAMLNAAPRLRILVTSRERLNLQEETTFRVGGIKLPEGTNGANAMDNDAVRLFVGRAQQAQPDFTPDAADLAAIARICRLVEGMPLGIVLAAAWMELLSPAEIADEITRSLDFLQTEMRNMPERHRSIRGVFESAWKRMSDNERNVFARLATFRGGFTREAAQQVAGATLPTLMALVNKSLLRRDMDGRYSIHELLRQYAAEQLVQSGEWDSAFAAHSQYFLEHLGEQRSNLESLDEVEADIDNLRVAWSWAIDQRNYGLIDRTLDNLHQFCIRRSRYWDALKLFNSALELAEHHPDNIEPRIVLRLREYRGKMRALLGMEEFEGALADLTYVRDAAHALGDFAWERDLLVHIGQLFRKTERHDEAVRHLSEFIRFARKNRNMRALADALYHLGTVYWDEGDNTNRGAYYQEAIAICDELGLRDIVAVQAHHGMGESLLMSGQPDQAIAHFQKSLELARLVGDQSYEAENLQMIGWGLLGIVGTGDYPGALDKQRQAVEISLDYHLHWHTMCSLIGYGLAQCGTGDYAQGLASIHKALKMAESVGLARFRSMALDALGQQFQDLNLLEQAEALHTQGIQAMLRAESTFWLPRLQANHAIDRVRQGDLNVEDELISALDIATSRGQEFHAVRCLEGLAELYVARGEPEQAIQYADQLGALAGERHMRAMQTQALRWRGEALMLLGQLDAAHAVLEQAVQLADQVGHVRLIWDVRAALGRCARLCGDEAGAAQHEAIVQQIIDRIAVNLPSDDLRLSLPDISPAR